MIFVALVWQGYQFWRLVWGGEPIWPTSSVGAVDLKTRLGEVQSWFAGVPIYRQPVNAMDPPATYALLWLFLGWVTFTTARWLWAGMSIAALTALVPLVVRESGADTCLERVFVALVPLSMYATGATTGNGQPTVHLLPALLMGLLHLRRASSGLGDLIPGALALLALVKPSVAAPFVWIVLLTPGRLRPALLVGIAYCGLTLFASSYQEAGLWSLLRVWLARASTMSISAGESNLHFWLASVGLTVWIGPASALALLSLGAWVWRHRREDQWVIIGVSALVARFWTYHRWYDDLLLLLPMIARFRISKRGFAQGSHDVLAGLLFAMTLVTVVAPGGLYLFPAPFRQVYVLAQVLVWVAALVFPMADARRERLLRFDRRQMAVR